MKQVPELAQAALKGSSLPIDAKVMTDSIGPVVVNIDRTIKHDRVH